MSDRRVALGWLPVAGLTPYRGTDGNFAAWLD